MPRSRSAAGCRDERGGLVTVNIKTVPNHEPTDDVGRAHRLSGRLTTLAGRIEQGACINPTALLCIRNSKISERARLQYRARWIHRLIGRRRDTDSARLLGLMETAYVLILARQGRLANRYLARNRSAGAELAGQILRIQPGRTRLSHYCSRRTGPDPELLAVEFFARALDWQYIDGTEDYLAAMYCICRQPDLRFNLGASAGPKLRELAADWVEAAASAQPSGAITSECS